VRDASTKLPRSVVVNCGSEQCGNNSVRLDERPRGDNLEVRTAVEFCCML